MTWQAEKVGRAGGLFAGGVSPVEVVHLLALWSGDESGYCEAAVLHAIALFRQPVPRSSEVPSPLVERLLRKENARLRSRSEDRLSSARSTEKWRLRLAPWGLGRMLGPPQDLASLERALAKPHTRTMEVAAEQRWTLFEEVVTRYFDRCEQIDRRQWGDPDGIRSQRDKFSSIAPYLHAEGRRVLPGFSQGWGSLVTDLQAFEELETARVVRESASSIHLRGSFFDESDVSVQWKLMSAEMEKAGELTAAQAMVFNASWREVTATLDQLARVTRSLTQRN